jgi:hypothetical protein
MVEQNSMRLLSKNVVRKRDFVLSLPSFLAALEHHKMKQAGQESFDQYAPERDN